MSKAWRHALSPRRWPLWQLQLLSWDGAAPPPAALWLQRVRPGVRRLEIELGGQGSPVSSWNGQGEYPWNAMPQVPGSPAVQAVHGALLALHPPSVSGVMCGLVRLKSASRAG